MTSRPVPQCLTCRHWVSPLQRDDDDTAQLESIQICDAFKAGIPDAIWWNRFDHRQPFLGDGGIQWESLDGAPFPDWAMNDEQP